MVLLCLRLRRRLTLLLSCRLLEELGVLGALRTDQPPSQKKRLELQLRKHFLNVDDQQGPIHLKGSSNGGLGRGR